MQSSHADLHAAAHVAALTKRRGRAGVSLRKSQGSHYTPISLVAYLTEEVLRGRPVGASMRVLDPACGTGNFLVHAAREMYARGSKREHSSRALAHILSTNIFGIDIDAQAVLIARARLLELVAHETRAVRMSVSRALAAHVRVQDAMEPRAWSKPFDAPFDVILGNPPFLSQLKRGTVASRERARLIASATGGAVRRYSDLSAAFLLVSLDRLAQHGRLGFVMPLSFLSTGDASDARCKARSVASLRALWSCDESIFEAASVRVAALVFERASLKRSAPLRRTFGVDFHELPPISRDEVRAATDSAHATWAPLLGDAFGAPRALAMISRDAPTIGMYARATADFRDQYYGLRGMIAESRDATTHARGSSSALPAHALLTTKHIGLARCDWGLCPVRIHAEKFTMPRVEVARFEADSPMRGWIAARSVPKILVATQTKAMEAWVDARGVAVPLVPLLTVTPLRAEDLWLVAAAVASPVVAARAIAQFTGSALSAGAIKLSARQLLAMPAPCDRALWQQSASLFREASNARTQAARRTALERFGQASCAAHGLSGRDRDEMLRFWLQRADL
ncbi:MAG: N-6 DNA methylase [Limnohabitans sp.]|nr:N-6 DNA methylase [Limnohabitans sp.]